MPTRKYKYKVTRLDDSSCGNLPSKYILYYNKNTKVYARASTLGIMTFKRRKDAEAFRQGDNLERNVIKRVIPLGRGSVPQAVALADIDAFYEDIDLVFSTNRIRSPKGTICYPGVFVCD